MHLAHRLGLEEALDSILAAAFALEVDEGKGLGDLHLACDEVDVLDVLGSQPLLNVEVGDGVISLDVAINSRLGVGDIAILSSNLDGLPGILLGHVLDLGAIDLTVDVTGGGLVAQGSAATARFLGTGGTVRSAVTDLLANPAGAWSSISCGPRSKNQVLLQTDCTYL